MLNTKSFLAPIETEDGVRISVVGLHKWDEGVMEYTDLTEITKEMFDIWAQKLAPPLTLVGDLYIRKTIAPGEEFEEAYLDSIMAPEKEGIVKALAHSALTTDITLLCLEPTPEECHRRYLAEQCAIYEPELVVRLA